MNMYLKEWPNKTATLMLDDGAVLFTFHSVDEAVVACKDWYRCHVNEVATGDISQDLKYVHLI